MYTHIYLYTALFKECLKFARNYVKFPHIQNMARNVLNHNILWDILKILGNCE